MSQQLIRRIQQREGTCRCLCNSKCYQEGLALKRAKERGIVYEPTGPDGWGATPAIPTLDNLSGFGLNDTPDNNPSNPPRQFLFQKRIVPNNTVVFDVNKWTLVQYSKHAKPLSCSNCPAY
jgi:hypothetical protein